MPAHQAPAAMACAATGPPVSSPRTVSVMGVNGWYSANHRSPAGIDPAGTNPLPRNGSTIRNIGVLLADSTVLAASPRATVSQVNANAAAASIPAGASPPSGPASGRNPISTATPRTSATLSADWIMLLK